MPIRFLLREGSHYRPRADLTNLDYLRRRERCGTIDLTPTKGVNSLASGSIANLKHGRRKGSTPMQTVSISKITESLRALPAEKLAVVYDFISYLSERELSEILRDTAVKALECMLASESVLRRDWDKPEEDAAWASL